MGACRSLGRWLRDGMSLIFTGAEVWKAANWRP